MKLWYHKNNTMDKIARRTESQDEVQMTKQKIPSSPPLHCIPPQFIFWIQKFQGFWILSDLLIREIQFTLKACLFFNLVFMESPWSS